ncbi:multiheme c-type cytochrome [Enhygromyxa salina]|uniref:multiheme c-type cytochrome n=1 Tax=Enhygromyxa salina TaxID=215803 RepID=UPI0011BA4F2C|nr:multiheme c-type cytochrome [Enhygromyxa salina]
MTTLPRPWAVTFVLGAVGLAALWVTAGSSRPAQASPTESLQNPLTLDFQCSGCHQFANNPLAEDLPPHAPAAYFGTLMANAARDPVFWAGVALASDDYPGETEDCVRCHAPRAFLEGRGDAIAMDELIPPDFNSVSCEVCHRAIDDGVTPPGNARFVLDDTLVDGEPARRGPWGYVDPEGPPLPPHPIIQDLEFLPSSRMCGTCHDVTTGRARLDDQGAPIGVNFNEQRTYSEWLGSVYAQPGDEAQTCQDCHMALVEVPAAGCMEYENIGEFAESGARRHLMLGANMQALRVIADNSPGANGNAIDVALGLFDEFLATAATLEVQFPAAVDLQAGIDALDVRVTNNTGHKLPTGYSEGRVMWLEVTARYAGEIVWSSGLWDGAEIEQDSQLRSYEGVAQRWADGTRNHLLLNDHWVHDTRIPPKGLVQDIQTDPVGDRYAPLPDDTWPHYDDHSYAFGPVSVVDVTPDDASDDELELELRLLYVINTQSYLDQLRDDNDVNDAGQAVHDMYMDDGGPAPMVLSTAAVTVPLTGLEQPDPGDGDGDGDPGDGDGDGDGDPGDGDGDGDPAGMTSESGGEAAGGNDDGGGCGCAVGGAGGPLTLGVGSLLLLLGVRRRRR